VAVIKLAVEKHFKSLQIQGLKELFIKAKVSILLLKRKGVETSP